uniref:Putative fused putative transporter subunits of ABC superfamily: ATP-binding components n=1 Tax=Magnetococcus massalia (strain MO-1) TaxID=451514 RepID=A0A1S7LJ28_MAGMO|nr:Putative fused putative transporter subunits of ABC superfamily: ATP-binding components [Candidatus Magnetococcus massalia]
MLRLDKVEKQFGSQIILAQADLVIHPGEKVGLIGLNGQGKTTLFRLIEAVEGLDGGKVERTPPNLRIGVLRQELAPSGNSILHETLGGVPELVEALAEREKVQQALEDPKQVEQHDRLVAKLGELDHTLEDLGAYDAEARAGAILHGLGFTNAELAKSLDAFSGGWRMRVALAQLLFAAPDLMLLDEPTNHLDMESVAWLERYLVGQPGAYMLISHDRDFLQRTTRITVELEGGKLTRHKGDLAAYFEWKSNHLALLAKQHAKQAEKMETMQRFIDRFRAKATKAKQVQSRVKQLEKIAATQVALPNSDSKAPVIRLPDPPPCVQDVAILEKLQMAYGEKRVLTQCQLNIQKGNRIALLGPNGQGKSTLLKLLAQSLTPTGGSLTLGDRVVPGFFAQHAMEALKMGDTILESARAVAPAGTTETQLRSVLGGLLFSGDRVEKLVDVLSGGEKARLALARLFLSGANLLLLDEPSNHLDMPSRAALEEALESYKGTLILVSHDRSLLESVCNRHIALSGGQIIELEDGLESYLENFMEDGGCDDSKAAASDEPPKRDDKAIKRQAAEIRNTLHQQSRPLRREYEKLEQSIEQWESRKAELDEQLTDASLYEEDKKDQLKEILDANRKLEQHLSDGWQRWEELGSQIEELESRAKEALEAL